jgi:glucan endo-1,3-beta-D-glucosidase
VWSTETGWPVKGKNFDAAISGVSNAQGYWKAVACPSFNQIDQFWYAYSERSSDPDFSIVDVNDQPLFDMAC